MHYNGNSTKGVYLPFNFFFGGGGGRLKHHQIFLFTIKQSSPTDDSNEIISRNTSRHNITDNDTRLHFMAENWSLPRIWIYRAQ